MFELFDPQAGHRVTAGRLPHWYQPGVTYFVTFRTDDSIPGSVATLWYRKRADWLRRHGIDPGLPCWKQRFDKLPWGTRREFHTRFSTQFLLFLDKGYGECRLKQPECSAVVAQSLFHFDRERYVLGDFVVMPNHVHLLVCLLGETEIESQCTSWKRFTARAINVMCQGSGRFWQEESFDHLVRSVDQLEAIQRYIANNPSDAGLQSGEFLHYSFGDDQCRTRFGRK